MKKVLFKKTQKGHVDSQSENFDSCGVFLSRGGKESQTWTVTVQHIKETADGEQPQPVCDRM